MAGNVTIYVGNLPLEMSVEELEREFLTFGKVASVNLMNDKYIGSGQPRGYGFVEMPERSEAKAAITGLNGRALKGQAVELIEALPLSDKGRNGFGKGSKYDRSPRRGRKRAG